MGKHFCFVCKQSKLRQLTEIHHIVPRHRIKWDTPDNLVRLCLECHELVDKVAKLLAQGREVFAREVLHGHGLPLDSIERHLGLCRKYISDFDQSQVPKQTIKFKNITVKLPAKEYKLVVHIAHERGFKHPKEFLRALLVKEIPDLDSTG